MPDDPPQYIENKILMRPRLNELLEQGLKYNAITVTAGLGYGKTTILKSFFRTKNICVWLNLKTAHQDPQIYWEDLIAATAKAKPSITDTIIKYKIPQSLQDLEAYASFINEEFKNSNLYFVLDDYSVLKIQKQKS